MHQGGRFNPFVSNYRPQLFLRTADVTVALTWPEGTPDASEKMVCRPYPVAFTRCFNLH